MKKREISETTINKSISACLLNAERLIEDAQTLEFEKPPSSKYYFAIISQEESAKAFLLYLVKVKIIPWNEFILRAMNSHICKQLVGIVIDYLEPDFDTFVIWCNNKTPVTKKVKDAINILRNEIIKKWESNNWIWADDYKYDSDAKKVFNKKFDKLKQRSLYVAIGEQAEIISTPRITTEENAQKEFDKAKRFLSFGKSISKGEKNHFRDYEIIEEGFRKLFSDIKTK